MLDDPHRDQGSVTAWWKRALGLGRFDEYDLNHSQRFEIKRSERRAAGSASLMLGTIGGLCAGVGPYMLQRAFPSVTLATRFVIVGATLLALGIAARWWFVHASRVVRARHGKLREFGVPICDDCGYSLSGGDPNTGPCPECGRDLAKMPIVRMANTCDAD